MHTCTYNAVCPSLSLENGDVSYSITNRDIGSVATHTCNPGYRLSPQGGATRICTINNGWDGQNVTCGEQITLNLVNNINHWIRYAYNNVSAHKLDHLERGQ